LLEQPSAKQKEQQSCERIEISFAAPGNDFVNTLREEREEAGRNRNVDVEQSLPQAEPGRTPVIGRTVEEDGQREHEAEVAEQFSKGRPAEAIQSQVGGDAEQHDVPEGKAGDGQLQPKPPWHRGRV
jgi:hypothetical protein